MGIRMAVRPVAKAEAEEEIEGAGDVQTALGAGSPEESLTLRG